MLGKVTSAFMGTAWGLFCFTSVAVAAYVNYTLVIDPDATDRVQINLPTVDYEEDASVKYETRSPSVYVFQDFIMNPHTNTGWHIHPGLVLITIAEGSVEWFDSNCVNHTHKTGDFFTESDQLHFVQNAGDIPARLIITYIIAKGETNKIYQPAPSCAAALGLDKPRVSSLRQSPADQNMTQIGVTLRKYDQVRLSVSLPLSSRSLLLSNAMHLAPPFWKNRAALLNECAHLAKAAAQPTSPPASLVRGRSFASK